MFAAGEWHNSQIGLRAIRRAIQKYPMFPTKSGVASRVSQKERTLANAPSEVELQRPALVAEHGALFDVAATVNLILHPELIKQLSEIIARRHSIANFVQKRI